MKKKKIRKIPYTFRSKKEKLIRNKDKRQKLLALEMSEARTYEDMERPDAVEQEA